MTDRDWFDIGPLEQIPQRGARIVRTPRRDALRAFLQERGAPEPEDFEVLREDVRFMLPKAIRQGMTAAAGR